MFSQASVIVLTGGCLPQCMLGYTPWWQTPPEQTPPSGADTPRADTTPWSRHPPRSRHPLKQTPPRADTSGSRQPPPKADTPQSRHPPPRSRPPRADPLPAEHAGRYAQRAGGTHPTGMQSCLLLFLSFTCRVNFTFLSRKALFAFSFSFYDELLSEGILQPLTEKLDGALGPADAKHHVTRHRQESAHLSNTISTNQVCSHVTVFKF